jgi:hypothetical protein
MSPDIEGEVIQRLEPDETDAYEMHEAVRRNVDDRTLIVVRTGDRHPESAVDDAPVLSTIVHAVLDPLVGLGLLAPLETVVVAVRTRRDVEVGDELALEAEPVVIDGHGDVLLYYPSPDVAGLRRGVEATLTAASSRADP